MSRVITAIPALVLVALSCVAALAGAAQVSYGLAFTGSGAGVGAAAVGIGLVTVALAIGVVAVGVLQRRRLALHAGLAIAGFGILVAIWVGRSAFQVAYLMTDRSGKLQPFYDTGAILIAVSVVPLVVAFGCLAVAERQSSGRRNQPNNNTSTD